VKNQSSILSSAARVEQSFDHVNYERSLGRLLKSNLCFHGCNGRYSTHAWHPFPAKFPPQLPEAFISGLTFEGETVFDPMMGSGTTLVEAARLGRKAIGCDIDPLARLIVGAKLAKTDFLEAAMRGKEITSSASKKILAGKEFF